MIDSKQVMQCGKTHKEVEENNQCFGCSKYRRCLRKWNRAPDAKPATQAKHKDQEWLQAKYLDERLSMRKIAALAGVGANTVRLAMIEFNIPARPQRHKRLGL